MAETTLPRLVPSNSGSGCFIVVSDGYIRGFRTAFKGTKLLVMREINSLSVIVAIKLHCFTEKALLRRVSVMQTK